MMTYRKLLYGLLLSLGIALPTHADNAQKHHHTAISPKMASGYHNPILDFTFSADPTSVEYNGRLYVYATNDYDQYAQVGKDGKNTYEKIFSLHMMSTDDLVNWTYHGTIPVKKISPWIMNSWAPSITKRVEEDGLTHFYLYYSDSGRGVGVLTSTSPVGPWTDPLGTNLVNNQTPGLGVPAPFDPGVVIDDQGIGWLAFGGGEPKTYFQPGHTRIARLGKDMISFDSDFITIDAPYFFEASELNYINNTWVYTYNTSWVKRDIWPFKTEKPSQCCMSYMTSKTPLIRESWEYQHNYLKNPGDYGFPWSNNHTHLQKYRGKWYILYHTMTLQESFQTQGGFRNICIDEIEVDEANVDIKMGNQTKEGVQQIQPLNPFLVQQAETTAATQCIQFNHTEEPGNLLAQPVQDQGMLLVRGVSFDHRAKHCKINASGQGTIEVRQQSAEGTLLATINVHHNDLKTYKTKLKKSFKGVTDLCFILKGNNLLFDNWTFQ